MDCDKISGAGMFFSIQYGRHPHSLYKYRKCMAVHHSTKEDRGIEQQLYETVRGKNFAVNCLSWKFTEMIMITHEVIPENLDIVR